MVNRVQYWSTKTTKIDEKQTQAVKKKKTTESITSADSKVRSRTQQSKVSTENIRTTSTLPIANNRTILESLQNWMCYEPTSRSYVNRNKPDEVASDLRYDWEILPKDHSLLTEFNLNLKNSASLIDNDIGN